MKNQLSETDEQNLINRIENGLIEEPIEHGYEDEPIEHGNLLMPDMEFHYDIEEDYWYCIDDSQDTHPCEYFANFFCFIDDDLVYYAKKTKIIGICNYGFISRLPSQYLPLSYTKKGRLKPFKWRYSEIPFDIQINLERQETIVIVGKNEEIDTHFLDCIYANYKTFEEMLDEWKDEPKYYEYIKHNLKKYFTDEIVED